MSQVLLEALRETEKAVSQGKRNQETADLLEACMDPALPEDSPTLGLFS